MINFDISIISVHDQLIDIDRGYLEIEDQLEPKTWEIELFGADNDNLFNRILDNREKPIVKLGTANGSEFVAKAIITKLECGPLGNKVELKGTGELTQVK